MTRNYWWMALALMLAAWALPCVAQTQFDAKASETAARPPGADWTGYYAIARGKALAGLKPLNPNIDEVILAHLQPWARAKLEATDGIADDTGQVCQPDGIFRFPLNGGSFLFLP